MPSLRDYPSHPRAPPTSGYRDLPLASSCPPTDDKCTILDFYSRENRTAFFDHPQLDGVPYHYVC